MIYLKFEMPPPSLLWLFLMIVFVVVAVAAAVVVSSSSRPSTIMATLMANAVASFIYEIDDCTTTYCT